MSVPSSKCLGTMGIVVHLLRFFLVGLRRDVKALAMPFLLVVRMLLVVMPGATNSVLAPSSDAPCS